MREIPAELDEYYKSNSSLWLFNGNLQIRGLSPEPIWNGLYRYWFGENAFFRRYDSISESDVPFGQDCFGDQFFLRDGEVWRLLCETDEVENTGLTFSAWLKWIGEDPVENLNINLDRKITPGKILVAFPPFCTAEGSKSSINEIDLDEAIEAHALWASKIRNLKDGENIEVRFEPDP